MGIFTRFRDIVSSNINAMLDKAEDPEKLIKLMIHEIEDTLVELKSSCAGVMAESKKLRRRLNETHLQRDKWNERAGLAVKKNRDDLAREALKEKRRFAESAESIEKELADRDEMVSQYQQDIRELEDRLEKAREKQRMLVQRHIRARRKRRAQEDIRRADNIQTVAKFEDLENRIERMEAEADLVNYGRHTDMEEAFADLATDEDIERELADLKAATRPDDQPVGVNQV